MGRPSGRSHLGRDLLDSVHDLFCEAASKGFTSQTQFGATASLVMNFLVACGTMTGARARASHPITFPDGSQPETDIQLPPSTLKLDGKAREMLRQASSAAEFQSVLKTTMEAQWHSDPKNKRKAEVAAGKERGGKRRIRIKIKGPSKFDGKAKSEEPRADTNPALLLPPLEKTAPATPDFNFHTLAPTWPLKSLVAHAEHGKASGPDQGPADGPHSTPHEPGNDAEPGVSDNQCGTDKGGPEATCENEPSIIPETVGNNQIDTNMDIPEAACQNEVQATTEEAVTKDNMPAYSLEAMEMNGHFPDEPATDSDPAAVSAFDLNKLVGEVATTTSEEWAVYQPKLIASLRLLKESQLAPRISLDPVAANHPTNRLLYAMSYLGDDFPMVASPEWEPYGQELKERCASAEFLGLDFRQRLMVMVDVCYLPEELKTMATGDWDALVTVARLCTVLAAVTGAEDEEMGSEAENLWLRSKMRDIAWLKKFCLTKQCVAGIEGLSMDG